MNASPESAESSEVMRSFTLASVAPNVSDRSSPLEELDCRWIWALDLRRVKVHAAEVRDKKPLRNRRADKSCAQ
jgi:hypothetical protein